MKHHISILVLLSIFYSPSIFAKQSTDPASKSKLESVVNSKSISENKDVIESNEEQPTHTPKTTLSSLPEDLAEQQLNAYNSGNINAFLAPYSEDVEIYNFPNELKSKGKADMRESYSKLFQRFPKLHCELLNRIVDGNTVIDHERITGIPDQEPFTAVAIYKIKDGKIKQVYFSKN